MRSVQIKLDINGNVETAHMLMDAHGHLVGVMNIASLRRWMENRGEFLVPANKIAVSETDQRDIRLTGDTPCWFPGCEELRAGWKAEVEALKNRPSGVCKPCERGNITKKYLELAAAAQANGSP